MEKSPLYEWNELLIVKLFAVLIIGSLSYFKIRFCTVMDKKDVVLVSLLSSAAAYLYEFLHIYFYRTSK